VQLGEKVTDLRVGKPVVEGGKMLSIRCGQLIPPA
jgi:hypothetical protein